MLLGTNGSSQKTEPEKTMKKILLGTVGLAVLGLSAPASAADLAARPYTKAPPPVVAMIYDWSGFYIGANGGWGTSHNSWTRTNDVLAGPLAPGLAEGSHDADGGTAGGQIGYRWQAGAFVFGLEAQGNWADFRGSNVSLIDGLVTNRTKIDAFGLFTGQVGYAINNALLYVKGGGAVVDNKYEGIFGGVVADRVNDTQWGGTVGAGVEFGFAPNWSAGVEYDHIFLGKNNYTLNFTGGGGFSRNDDIKQDVDMVTVRVNYRWGGPVIAKY
jgi:outer membrane immunogenic protein